VKKTKVKTRMEKITKNEDEERGRIQEGLQENRRVELQYLFQCFSAYVPREAPFIQSFQKLGNFNINYNYFHSIDNYFIFFRHR
jgi:hypothetical protein